MPSGSFSNRVRSISSVTNKKNCGGNKKAGLASRATGPTQFRNVFFNTSPTVNFKLSRAGLPCPENYSNNPGGQCAGGVGALASTRSRGCNNLTICKSSKSSKSNKKNDSVIMYPFDDLTWFHGIWWEKSFADCYSVTEITHAELPSSMYDYLNTNDMWIDYEIAPAHITSKDGLWSAYLAMGNHEGITKTQPLFYTDSPSGIHCINDGVATYNSGDKVFSTMKIQNRLVVNVPESSNTNESYSTTLESTNDNTSKPYSTTIMNDSEETAEITGDSFGDSLVVDSTEPMLQQVDGGSVTYQGNPVDTYESSKDPFCSEVRILNHNSFMITTGNGIPDLCFTRMGDVNYFGYSDSIHFRDELVGNWWCPELEQHLSLLPWVSSTEPAFGDDNVSYQLADQATEYQAIPVDETLKKSGFPVHNSMKANAFCPLLHFQNSEGVSYGDLSVGRLSHSGLDSMESARIVYVSDFGRDTREPVHFGMFRMVAPDHFTIFAEDKQCNFERRKSEPVDLV